MTIAQTSRAAFAEHKASGRLGQQQLEILAFLRLDRDMYDHGFTRNEIARKLGLPIPSVCGRVNELITAGYLAEGARRKCSVTGRTAYPVRIAT